MRVFLNDDMLDFGLFLAVLPPDPTVSNLGDETMIYLPRFKVHRTPVSYFSVPAIADALKILTQHKELSFHHLHSSVVLFVYLVQSQLALHALEPQEMDLVGILHLFDTCVNDRGNSSQFITQSEKIVGIRDREGFAAREAHLLEPIAQVLDLL
jgi:hypothetical protein